MKNVVLICERKSKKLQCSLSLKCFIVQNCLYSEHTMILRFEEPRTGLCWLCSQGVYTRPPNTSTLSQTSPNDQEWTKIICHVTEAYRLWTSIFKDPFPFLFMYFSSLYSAMFCVRELFIWPKSVHCLAMSVSQSVCHSLA